MRRPLLLLTSILLGSLLFVSAAQNVRAADGTIILIARFYAAPGREAEVEARFTQLVAFVRKAEPNITYHLHRSQTERRSSYLTRPIPTKPPEMSTSTYMYPRFRNKSGQRPKAFLRARRKENFFVR